MKIYSQIVLDWNGNELASKSFDYDGEIALCGGGKSQSYTPPPVVQKAQTKPVDESQTVARQNQQEQAKRSKGIKSTILTQQEEQQQLAANTKKTVLG